MKHPLVPTLVMSLVLGTATLSGAALAQSASGGTAGDAATAEQTAQSGYQFRTSGSVIKADKEAGIYKITTRDGNYQLHFPPQAVQDLNRWDKVILQVALVPGSGAAPNLDAPDFKGVHTMQGTVKKVKAEKGEVTVKTDAGKLKMYFPKQPVDKLEKKSPVTVAYGYKKTE